MNKWCRYRIWYNNGTKKIHKLQLVAVVLSAAPVEYAAVLTSEQQKQGTGLAISHLRVAMNKYYRAVFKSGNPITNDDEMALTLHQEKSGKSTYNKGQGSKKKFSSNCHNCGKRDIEQPSVGKVRRM